MELTVHSQTASDLNRVALQWLTTGVGKLVNENEPQRTDQSLAVRDDGFERTSQCLPRKSSNETWGVISLTPQNELKVLRNPYNDRGVEWLAQRIGERPDSAKVNIGKLTVEGDVGNSDVRMEASFDEDLPEYVKLRYYVDESVLTGPATSDNEHARLLELAKWGCRQFNVIFGHFSYNHAGGATELERYLRGWSRVPSRNTPEWRERLRGYSWLMVVPGEIAEKLGGEAKVKASGAFSAVSSMPNGSLLLQATSLFQEYREGQVSAVHRVFRKVLIEGSFRNPSPAPGQPPAHMVVFEAGHDPGSLA